MLKSANFQQFKAVLVALLRPIKLDSITMCQIRNGNVNNGVTMAVIRQRRPRRSHDNILELEEDTSYWLSRQTTNGTYAVLLDKVYQKKIAYSKQQWLEIKCYFSMTMHWDELRFQIVSQLPYSPDLAPPDFHLFAKLPRRFSPKGNPRQTRSYCRSIAGFWCWWL